MNVTFTNTWLSSSLRTSPVEQVRFLRKLVRRELPVSDDAMRNMAIILRLGVQPNDWHVFGKAGTGLPRDKAGKLLRGQPFGWFVGWAERAGRKVVFARLIQEMERPSKPAGLLARDSVLADLFSEYGQFK